MYKRGVKFQKHTYVNQMLNFQVLKREYQERRILFTYIPLFFQIDWTYFTRYRKALLYPISVEERHRMPPPSL